MTVELSPGARKLGCRGCTLNQQERFPEIGKVYCGSCPVTYRQQDGKPWRITRHEKETR